jgi:hypothetical protein
MKRNHLLSMVSPRFGVEPSFQQRHKDMSRLESESQLQDSILNISLAGYKYYIQSPQTSFSNMRDLLASCSYTERAEAQVSCFKDLSRSPLVNFSGQDILRVLKRK